MCHLQIEKDGVVVAKAELEIEIESEEIDSKDVITYDDQDVGVECIA